MEKSDRRTIRRVSNKPPFPYLRHHPRFREFGVCRSVSALFNNYRAIDDCASPDCDLDSAHIAVTHLEVFPLAVIFTAFLRRVVFRLVLARLQPRRGEISFGVRERISRPISRFILRVSDREADDSGLRKRFSRFGIDDPPRGGECGARISQPDVDARDLSPFPDLDHSRLLLSDDVRVIGELSFPSPDCAPQIIVLSARHNDIAASPKSEDSIDSPIICL